MSAKNIDNLIQPFIQKCVQVIVQSRLGTERTQTKCNPNGKDWFNLDIPEMKDISENTNKCLKQISAKQPSQNSLFIKKEWKICCEISLKNTDGISIVLEYWIFTNVPFDKDNNQDEPRLSQNQYIRMSNMLKSLIVLTRSTPAYRLSCKGQSADSYVICYRVYQINDNFTNFMQSSDHSNHYSAMKCIGSIKNSFNELTLSLIYRTDMNINSESEIKNLAKNEKHYEENNDDLFLSIKDNHFEKESVNETLDMCDIIKPLNPAFATNENGHSNSDLNTPFSSLLPSMTKDKSTIDLTRDSSSTSSQESHHRNDETKSNPISIPDNFLSKPSSKSPQIYSTSNESFVFVDLNPPFASDDSVLKSFFNGPSPTFINTKEENNDLVELSQQLAELESNVPQFDNFVESICINESDDFKF